MRVGEYCNREVIVAERTTGVIEAARLMRRYHVGNLVIVEREHDIARPVGIVTDRDLVVEVLAQDAPPAQLALDDVMSAHLATASEDDDVLETLRRMRSLGVRRMPVVDGRGALAGILAVDDLLELMAGSLHEIVGLIARELRTEEQRRP
ncbi:CBS domain-containing protein [Fontimonas sp. SYSU GA230001]|uniref:CBS domain-containing protein n=1 Tax=Fontimonas sp. SYSU GA230001 TaxID=3142450 RepID=UPI0032B4BC97